MRSQLTKTVFRAILANEPYFAPQCRQASTLRRPQRHAHNWRHWSRIQRRSLFGFPLSMNPKRTMQRNLQQEDRTDPGLAQMMKLKEDIRTHSQTSPKPQLTAAFRAFFKSRCGRPRGLTPKQLEAATQTFHFLHEENENGPLEFEGLSKEDLALTLKALDTCRKNNDAIPSILSFARLIHGAIPNASGEAQVAESSTGESSPTALQSYAGILAQAGLASEARHLLEAETVHKPENGSSGGNSSDYAAWSAVLEGLTKERKLDELLDCLKRLKRSNNTINPLIKMAARMDDLALAKTLHAFQRSRSGLLRTMTYKNLLMLALNQNDTEYGNEIVEELQTMESEPTSRRSAINLLWSTRGKNPKDIVLMLENDISDEENKSERRTRNVQTLLDYYIPQGNTAVSAQLLVYMQENGLEPAQEFPLLELKHLINVQEWPQAYDAYENLQSVEVSADDELPVVTELLKGLCSAKDVPHERIMTVLEDLIKRDADIGPETVAAATKALIGHGDLTDLSTLLRDKVGDFYAGDLDRIQEEFVRVCQDSSIDELRAWDVYEEYRKLFPDAPVEIRTEIMNSFFKRGHSDLACLVFGHMRQSEIPKRRPRADTYAECYMGLAAAGDREGLKLVHNMLKLDLEITPNLKIKNSLIAAYAGCNLSYRSFEIYEEVLNSTEGPNWRTFAHALRACEKFPGPGGDEAKTIMQTLKARDIDLNREIYIAYVGALAGNLDVGLVTENEIFQALHDMESLIGEKPDAFTIATLYNAIPWQYDKTATVEWAEDAYPEQWAELRDVPRYEDEDGEIVFAIDRTIPP